MNMIHMKIGVFVKKMLRVFSKERRLGSRLLYPIRRSISHKMNYSSAQIAPKTRIWPWAVGISTVTIGGGGFYLYKSSSLQVLDYAKHYAKTNVDVVTWRETIAAALLEMGSQEQGREVILRYHWGSTIASWIVEDSKYVTKI